MSTRRTTTVTEEDAPEDGDLIEVIDGEDEIEDAALDALDGMISEFTGSADTVVNVYCQGEGKNLSFLYRTNPDEMTGGEIMEKCRDHYGTGDYRVHIRKGPRLVANKPFSVMAKKEPDPATQQPQGIGIAEVIAMMQASNDRMAMMFSETMKAMGEGMKGRETPQFDPVSMQTAMIQSVAALKQMTEKPDNSRDAVDMLVEGLKIAQSFNPKEGETNSSDIVLKALETFGKPLVEAGQKAGATPGNGQAAITGPLDPQAAADAERERQMGIRQAMIRQQLHFLVTNAAAGKNPELYAELLLDQLGETVVLEFVGKPDAMDQLIAIDPGVAQYPQWFESLRRSILELTAPASDTGSEGLYQGAPEFGQPGSVIIPGVDQGAIPDAADDGDATGDLGGERGDTGNA